MQFQNNLLLHCLNSKKLICIPWILFIISIIHNPCNICTTMYIQPTQLIVAISKRDGKKSAKILQIRVCAPLSIRSAQAGRPAYFMTATVASIKYLALIFEYSNLFRERVKITTCPFFFSLAALNYDHGRIVPSKMQIGVHSFYSSWPHFAQILYNL